MLQEEALRAFVEPETLDGSNQYFCEKCACKCDAHKVLVCFVYYLQLLLLLVLKGVDWRCRAVPPASLRSPAVDQARTRPVDDFYHTTLC